MSSFNPFPVINGGNGADEGDPDDVFNAGEPDPSVPLPNVRFETSVDVNGNVPAPVLPSAVGFQLPPWTGRVLLGLLVGGGTYLLVKGKRRLLYAGAAGGAAALFGPTIISRVRGLGARPHRYGGGNRGGDQ